MMADGIKNGEIRRGPPSIRFVCSRSMISNPPMPEPMWTPTRSSFSGVIFRPDICIASSAAAIAKWMKRPIFLTSFFFDVLQRVEVFHLGGDLAGEVAGIEAADARYAALASQQGLPHFISGIAHAADEPQARDYDPASVVQLFSRLGVLADIVDGILHGANFFSVLVGNFDVESFFESHDQFHGVERIGAEVVDE